ncbi:hypothetical protein ACFPPA_02420 [Rhodanobacter ginsengisoli]|uniref:Lipoprotein n=1 Tax=Rhodanobacter ginsengisoli TaxID=418646 RepID=A0ABW0QJS3_9GAMM
MHRLISIISVLAVCIGLAVGAAACAGSPVQMDAAALRAYASKPWDKAALMNTTVELGRYRNVPVVAEFPCSDVCPQYTVRIIHYRLPADTRCASVGGVEKDVLVPIAITVRQKTFCIPQPLVASGQYYSK